MRILLLLPLVAFVAACSIYRQRLNAQAKPTVILSENEESLVKN